MLAAEPEPSLEQMRLGEIDQPLGYEKSHIRSDQDDRGGAEPVLEG